MARPCGCGWSSSTDTPDNVLYHDDLNPGARAFALHEVLDAAARHGLKFLAEASFPNLYGAAKGPAQAMLARIPAEEAVQREQSLDLLIGRAFRETLLCRAEVPLRRGISARCAAPLSSRRPCAARRGAG